MKILKDNSTIILLFLILIISIFFRFYNLSSVPPSPSLDEVTTGYNAYSLLKTGKDEYGNKFPMLLRAYDDFRPAGYVYTVIPFVKLLGLNVLSVRLPSAIMSIASIILAFFLCVLIFDRYPYKYEVALMASLLVGISPWHIYISRLGHEVNLGQFIIILSVFCYFIALRVKKYSWMLIVSMIFFSLSFYTYQSEKVFTPLYLLLILILFYKEILKIKKILFISIIFALIITIPVFRASISIQGLTRFKYTSAFSDTKKIYDESAIKLLHYKQQNNILGILYENRRLIPLKIFLSNYLSHLNPRWLYTGTSNESFKAPGIGLFYQWEMILFIFGLFIIFRVFDDKRFIVVLLAWIGFSFIAPSITTQSPHALRSFTLFPAPQIIEATGIIFLINIFKNHYWRKLMFTITILVIFISSFHFFKQYFFEFPRKESQSFQYALHNAMKYVVHNKSNYNEVIFSNTDNLSQSYMFYLFYSKYDPEVYLREGGTKSGGFAEFHKFDSVDFRPINWQKDRKISNALLVGNTSDFPTYAKVVYRGYYIDGKEGVDVVSP